jgi:hypothetical protein
LEHQQPLVLVVREQRVEVEPSLWLDDGDDADLAELSGLG